jgi:hypothetical protein
MKAHTALIFVYFILSSCADEAGYDQTIYDLAEKAAHGDWEAAAEAGSYCRAILKLGTSTAPGTFIGKCGGFEALAIENAIMSGDPDVIDTRMLLSDSRFKKYPKRREFYMDIAQYRIKKRCSEPQPPISCQDKEMLKKFGIESPAK